MDNYTITSTKYPVVFSTAVVCHIFEISRQTLTNWNRAGLPKHARGMWDLQELIRFRGLGSTGGLDGKEQSLAEQKLSIEIQYKEAQVELSRIKNDILAGKYLETYYVESELKRFFTVFKRSCLNLARKVGGQATAYVEPDIARRLEHEIHKTVTEALHQWSEGDLSVPMDRK